MKDAEEAEFSAPRRLGSRAIVSRGFGRGAEQNAVDGFLVAKGKALRLPVAMIEDLRVLANQRDVPDQSPLKAFLGREAG